jgi:hypothetical protein
MTGPAILFPDAIAETLPIVRRVLATRSEPYASGATVSSKFPPTGDSKPSLPWVRVSVDATSRSQLVNGRATVRVAVWHTDASRANALARLLEALLLASPSGGIRSFSPNTGPLDADDPDTAEPLSAFTLAARLRPEQL